MKIKKISYTLLFVLIALVIMSFTVSAEGDVASIGNETYATLTDAVTEANAMDGDVTITLLQDTTFSEMYTITGNITIEGAYTLTRDDAYTGSLFTVDAGASLTLDGDIVIDGNNNWTFHEDVFFEAVINNTKQEPSVFYTLEDGAPVATASLIVINGSLNLNDVTIQNNVVGELREYVLSAKSGSYLTFNGATITHCAKTAEGNTTILMLENAEAIINEGTVFTNNFGLIKGIIVGLEGVSVMTMNGGEIINNYGAAGCGVALRAEGISATERATFIMNGGLISGNVGANGTSASRNDVIYMHEYSEMIMYGGEISENWGTQAAVDVYKSTASVVVYGGSIINNIASVPNNDIDNNKGASGDAITLYGGEYTCDIDEFCAPGYTTFLFDDGIYRAVKLINVEFEDITPEGTEAEKLYNINLTTSEGDIINKLKSVDLTFAFDKEDEMGYEIIQSNPEFDINSVDNITPRYSFLYNADDNITTNAGEKINIGQVRFTGHGAFSFKVDSSVDTNAAYTDETDQTVDGAVIAAIDVFTPEIEAGRGYLNITYNTIEEVIPIPKRKLKVNIAFNNAIKIKAAAYQSMTFKVAGGTVSRIIPLGNENIDETEAGLIEHPAKVTVSEDGYVIELDLPYNTTYTVILEGAGYRTARYSVNLTDNKVLNFWNNIKEVPIEVEEGLGSSKVTHNFLAGDIIKDDRINIYDLSAILSYFGARDISEINNPQYIKYDINRDGVIDSIDVAYILVSWGK